MASESREYEIYVRDIVEALLRADGLENVQVLHDQQVVGLSRTHQVDVYWEYRLGGVRHRVIFNCKRYKKAVKVTDVLALAGVLADMPGVRGVVATTVGFERGAVDYAKKHGIGLKVIRQPVDTDWAGRVREVRMGVAMHLPKLTGCHVNLNHERANDATATDPDSLAGQFTSDAEFTTVRDMTTGQVHDMNELWNQTMEANVSDEEHGRGVLRWDHALLERPGATPLRVDSIEFTWTLSKTQPMEVVVRSDPKAIVRDAIEGTLLFVDPDGGAIVTGDTDKATDG